jgi:putative acetyltransferase
MLIIRDETRRDIGQVRMIHIEAFAQTDEANLVDALRTSCEDAVSLVAELDGRVVGHILFSPATVEAAGRTVQGMGLAPMAVLPEHQRDGIGARLVEEGMARLERAGCPFVIVLGHPGYYPRFGFERASAHGIECQWQVPDEAFMIRILDREAMAGAAGVARYRPEFDTVI